MLKLEGRTLLFASLALGVACGVTEDGDDAFRADECNTTGECKQIWGNQADDCLNSKSDQSVCMCGDVACSDLFGGDGDGDGDGTGVMLPAFIEAEDFVAFSDSDTSNSGNCGGDQPVDQQTTTDTGGGCNVGWTAAGEWLEYEVQAGSSGVYDLDLRLAANAGGRSVAVRIDGELVGSLSAPSNGWQAWQTRTLEGVALSAGSHTVRVEFTTGATNLNWLEFRDADTPTPVDGSCEIVGEQRQWHRIELLCDGPSAGENASATFTNYRMNVTFSQGSQSYVVPGHFAANGNAADTGSTSGNKWRAYFMAPSTGNWNYLVSMRSGSGVAVELGANAGSPVTGLDEVQGSFSVAGSNKSGLDMRARGLLEHRAGERYLRFRGNGKYFVEGGVDSPENLFGYDEFDNTVKFNNVGSCKGILHSFDPHEGDWSSGDPTWDGGRGKSLIGLINYIASTGVNAMYLVPMSVNGDGCDGHPWTDYFGNRRQFDVSKLDQWEIVFSHMNAKGLLIHFVTQETENDQLLNGGNLGLERKLYYREIISRFGHHPALQWNLGEENTNTAAQVKSFADYIKAVDPYDHPVVMHTYPNQHNRYDALLGHPTFDGPTLQFGGIPESGSGGLYGSTRDWIADSAAAGVPWYVTATEASGGDAPTPFTSVSKRQRVYWMWANVMAGGGGFEWYLKNAGAGHAYDLAVENMREFDAHWQQSAHVVEFFRDIVQGEGVDLTKLEIANGLTGIGSDWVLADPGDVYIVFLRDGGSVSLSVTGGGSYDVSWFNPRTGQLVDRPSIGGTGTQNLGAPPSQGSQDWVVFVRR